MEIQYKELRFGYAELYEDRFAVETEVDTAERGGIARALSVEAEAKISGVELLPGEARISGKVNYRLLYLDEQEKICGLDYFKDFDFTLQGENIRADEKWNAELAISEATSSVSGQTVTLGAVVGVSLRTFGEKEEKAVASVSGAEVREGSAETQSLLDKKESIIELAKEEDAGGNIKKILLFDVTAALTDRSFGADKATVSGEAKAHVVYLREDGTTAERNFSFPFTKEEETAGGNASFFLSVKNARIVLSGDEENAEIEIEIALSLITLLYQGENVSFLTDVFSEEKQTKETFKKVESRLFKEQNFFKMSLGGGIDLENAAERIVSVRPTGIALADLKAENGSVRAEGVASFAAVYESEGSYFSSSAELPFAFDLPFSCASETDEAEGSVSISSVSATLSSGGVVLTADVALSVLLYQDASFSFLQDVTEGESREENESGISVYFAEKGEDLWKIAKAMGVLPSRLLKSNPFLEAPLDEAKKVLVFRAK